MLPRALVLLCLGIQVASAAPRYPHKPIGSSSPELIEAERLWAVAAAEPDVGRATAAWERAAEAFIEVADAGKVTRPEQLAAAGAALSAWKNALDTDPTIKSRSSAERDPVDLAEVPRPVPIPPREQQLLHTMEVYLRLDGASPDAVGVKFLRASILRRFHHLDEAIPTLLDILTSHRDHETAEYAANLLLDTYNLLHRHDDLIALADKLRADAKFLANKPDLAAVVARIHVQVMRKAAEVLEKRATQDHDLALYDRCGETYFAIHQDAGRSRDGDELLYNAMMCHLAAGSVDRALAIATLLKQQYPASRLLPRALARRAGVEGQIGRFAAAAASAEEILARYPNDRESLDVFERAVAWRVALGEIDRAARDVDLVTKTAFKPTARGREQAVAIAGSLLVTEAMLAAGRRGEATRRALVVAPLVSRSVGTSSIPPLQAARLLADAACATPLVDELCTRPRDRRLAGAARAQLARVKDVDDPEGLAIRVTLDLELELVLAAPRPSALAIDKLRAGYEALAAAGRTARARISAHARLGRLARHTAKQGEAAAQLTACVAEARSSLVGADWLRGCERELAGLKRPVEVLHERLASPSAPIPEMSISSPLASSPPAP
ncbi:MAG: Tetratricopeptide repeat protein [Deltaproteobacteria bacterium]|nr:Tetratricopeptide repeat protein [Deltaproteobacteria bacterium]